jgi:hypothetical protein
MTDSLPPESKEPAKDDNQEGRGIKKIRAPKDWIIEEVESNQEDSKAEKAGIVEYWKRLDPEEKQKMCKYLTYFILPLWLIWTISGLIEYLLAGKSLLLATSSSMDVLLLIVFRYYFSK